MTLSTYDHEAIYRAYPNVVTISEAYGAFDVDGNPVEIESEKVNVELEKISQTESMRLLRVHRNKLLAETDWVTMKAYSTKTDVPTEWVEYQQALRDLPDTATPVLDLTSPIGISGVDWPVKPE